MLLYHARKRVTFSLVEDNSAPAHCLIKGENAQGNAQSLRVKFDPPPHPRFSLRHRTHLDIFQYAKSLGLVKVDEVVVVGKYIATTYVEDDPRPVKVDPNPKPI